MWRRLEIGEVTSNTWVYVGQSFSENISITIHEHINAGLNNTCLLSFITFSGNWKSTGHNDTGKIYSDGTSLGMAIAWHTQSNSPLPQPLQTSLIDPGALPHDPEGNLNIFLKMDFRKLLPSNKK